MQKTAKVEVTRMFLHPQVLKVGCFSGQTGNSAWQNDVLYLVPVLGCTTALHARHV